MNAKSLILIVIALGCGLVASIGISQVINQGGDELADSVETEKIFVAMVDIPTGEPISPQMIKLEAWPKGNIPEGAIATLEGIEKRRPKTPIFAGEAILERKLLAQGEDARSASEHVRSGYRAYSIPASAESTAGNLIKAGDRVDVLVFLRRNGEIEETGTKTILRNVRVFAVNDRYERTDDEDGSSQGAAKTVTLELKPDQAEKVALAEKLGELMLSLRRPDDEGDADEEGETQTTLSDLDEEGDSPAVEDAAPKAIDSPVREKVAGDIYSALSAAPPKNPASIALQDPKPSETIRILEPMGPKVFEWDGEHGTPVEVDLQARRQDRPSATPGYQPAPVEPEVVDEDGDAREPADLPADGAEAALD